MGQFEKDHMKEILRKLLRNKPATLLHETAGILYEIQPTTENFAKLQEIAANDCDNIMDIWKAVARQLCPECKETELQDSPDGPWCKKCYPDAPAKFHAEESGPY